jgi:hypothetical protein
MKCTPLLTLHEDSRQGSYGLTVHAAAKPFMLGDGKSDDPLMPAL